MLRPPPTNVLCWLVAAAVCAVVFLADLVLVLSGRAAAHDAAVRQTLYSVLHSRLPSPLFAFLRAIVLVGISRQQFLFVVGLLTAAVLVLTLALVRKGRRSSATLLLASIGGAVLGPAVLKSLIVRPPPHTYGGHTFPSGHATGWFALCAVLTYLVWHLTGRAVPTLTMGIIGGLLCALAGLYVLPYHYPSEVLGGYAFGGAWLATMIACFLPRLSRESDRRAERAGSSGHEVYEPGTGDGYHKASTRLHRPSISK